MSIFGYFWSLLAVKVTLYKAFFQWHVFKFPRGVLIRTRLVSTLNHLKVYLVKLTTMASINQSGVMFLGIVLLGIMTFVRSQWMDAVLPLFLYYQYTSTLVFNASLTTNLNVSKVNTVKTLAKCLFGSCIGIKVELNISREPEGNPHQLAYDPHSYYVVRFWE